ncbi:MAG: hypothetical protein ACI9XR_001739 [Flavobacterium sp.]|jgi:hypothetical protein
MFRQFPGEEFKEIVIAEGLKMKYSISNRGRMVSYENTFENSRLLKGSTADGYRIFRYKKQIDGKIFNKHVFIGKLIAKYFLPTPKEEETYVLHLDYVRDNDDYRNLKWATREEMLEHGRRSPHVIQAKKNLIEFNKNNDGRKLSVTKVIHIKKILANPNRKTRIKMIAKQFGVSEMQIARIRSGENWGHITI